MPDKRYQLIIFDWDGTLIDSQAHIIHCMRHAIIDEGLQPPDEDSIRHIIGLSLNGAIQTLFPRQSAASVQRMADYYREHFFSGEMEPSQPFAGAAETMRELHGRGHYLAVATGKGRRGLDIALETSGLGGFIHISRCADETRSKPDPLMLDEILTDLDMQAGDAVMVGDTSYDLDMATNIGMDSIAVTYGMHDREHLLVSNPTHFIDSIRQLPQYV